MAYHKREYPDSQRQVEDCSRWQKKLPHTHRLRALGGYRFWWVDGPDGKSVASGESARLAVLRTLAVLQAAGLPIDYSKQPKRPRPRKWRKSGVAR